MFWFTWTPIFKENSNSSLVANNTTADLFWERLHTYNVKNAIADKNVLRFSVEYFNTMKLKTFSSNDMNEKESEEEILNTNEKKLLEDNTRISNISDHILNDINKKTQNLKYNAIFATSNIPVALKYYKDMQSKNKDLKIGLIYSVWNPNQDRLDFSTKENLEIDDAYTNSSIELQKAADAYSKTFGVNKFDFQSKDWFENYRKDISRRMKKRESENLDLLIVVDMFLTWFDSKYINTIYVDKFLRYHLLLQAFSRTNRLADADKTQWNVVCFRNIVKDVNKSIRLFSDTGDDNELNDTSVIMEWFKTYINNVNEEVKKLRDIAPTPQAVDQLEKESDKIAFVNIMKDLNKNLTVATQFVDYDHVFVDIAMPEEFLDYKGKYLDIYEEIKELEQNEEDVNNELQEIDFELDLFQTDLINVDFIYQLLELYINEESPKKDDKLKKDISSKIDAEPRLRWIKEPILKYIEDTKRKRKDKTNKKEVSFDFDWMKTYIKMYLGLEISAFAQRENIIEKSLRWLFDNYMYFNSHSWSGEDIDKIFEKKPHFSERTKKRKMVREFIEWLNRKYWEHI